MHGFRPLGPGENSTALSQDFPARGGTIIVDFVGGRVRIFVPQRIATQLEIENLVLPYRSTVI
jgi:hypothetical protein